MDDTKRLILACVLSVIILFGYQFFFAKPAKEQMPNPPAQTTANKNDQSRKAVPASTPEQLPQAVAPDLPPPEIRKKSDSRTITVSTPLYTVAISESGAAVTSFELKNYNETNDADSPMKELVPKELTAGTLVFGLKNQSIPGLSNAVYTAQADASVYELTQGRQSIEFTFQTAGNIVVKKIYTFSADTYLVDCDIVIINGSKQPVEDDLYISTPGLFNKEVKSRSRLAFEGPIAFIDTKYNAIDPDDIEDQNTFTGTIGWSGFTERYFMTTVMPRVTEGQAAVESASVELSQEGDIVTASYVQKMAPIVPNKEDTYSFTFFMGPKSRQILNKHENDFRYAVNYGFFHVIAKPLLDLMNMIHSVIPNYGISIILLTILIKLIFWPLGTKSYKSMNAMKKLSPLMMELREKYKDDKQRMNQEIMGLYKTYKVNPASGCLPLLVQMPIFFALYRMLYQAIELRHAPFVGWITDLSGPERLFHFSFSIPYMTPPYGIPMLTILMGASFLLQQKMTPTAGDPMQAKMMMLMPLFMTVLFINFPSGLVLYMFVNNIISMGQQYYIQKKFA